MGELTSVTVRCEGCDETITWKRGETVRCGCRNAGILPNGDTINYREPIEVKFRGLLDGPQTPS